MGKEHKFLARAIIEIAGKPREHVEGTMKLVLKKLREDEGVTVKDEKMHDAEEHESIFSTFAEVEVELEGFDSLVAFCFEYLPSSVEFLEPEKTSIELLELTGIFNDLLGRLHSTDLRLKDAAAAIMVLDKNATNLLRRSVGLALMGRDKTLEEVSKLVGIKAEELKPFLEKFEAERNIKKKGDKYSL